ncbi:MAG TPA: BNR repeat-containing protein [Tepidisphaeraceae bacterium]|jgi:hypothetical protein
MQKLLVALIVLLSAAGVRASEPRVAEVVEVDRVWSGHSVGFALLTQVKTQYVAYFDAERRMIVASRELGKREWVKKDLGQKIGWDSHNYITMAIDDAGQLHVSGNMHANPMLYFVTTEPGDVTSLTRVEKLVGSEETRCTYPVFMKGASGQFIFTYRSGGSGNGNQIYNIYDSKTKIWRRLTDAPLTDGQGKMNAYFGGPTKGPDGFFHLCWVWRDTGDCATNHDLSYARSKDLVHWENGQGEPLSLPIKLGDDVIVDPVPAGGGIINGNTKIGFDRQKRVIVSYHKFDPSGNTQLYNARLENGAWKIYQASDWDYRWAFSGGGSIVFEVRVGNVSVARGGTLVQTYQHAKLGSGAWKLDEATLRPIGTFQPERDRPRELDRVESDFPGMSVRWAGDSGKTSGARHFLRWETLGPNRDRPRSGDLPEPSVLRVYRIESR